MERRVRLVVAVLLLVAVGSMAVPLALSIADRRTSALTGERDRQLRVLAQVATGDSSVARAVERYAAVYGEPVLVTDPDGAVLASSGGLGTTSPAVREALRLRLVDAPSPRFSRVLPWTTRGRLRSAAAAQDGEVAAVVLTRVDPRAAASDVRRDWLVVAAGCVALLLLAAVVARLLSRWTMRPVHSLERAMSALAQGEPGSRVIATGPAELRDVVGAFNQMAQTVRDSLEHQRRLVADASHQLRNPLAAVRLRADGLEGHLDLAGVASHARLVAELDRFEDLLDQLLRLARAQEVSTGRRAGGRGGEVALAGDVVRERMTAWSALAGQQDQRLVGPALDAPEPVDRSDLEQVLDVLLDNAIKHAGSGARVEVEAGRVDDLLRVRVVDDGPGVGGADDPEAWALARERFWRGDRGVPGSGLGLAIATEIVSGHHGHLVVRPGTLGGTVVEFTLPIAASASQEEPT